MIWIHRNPFNNSMGMEIQSNHKQNKINDPTMGPLNPFPTWFFVLPRILGMDHFKYYLCNNYIWLDNGPGLKMYGTSWKWGIFQPATLVLLEGNVIHLMKSPALWLCLIWNQWVNFRLKKIPSTHWKKKIPKGEMLAEGGVSLISTRNCICSITIVMLDSRRVPYFGAFNRFQFYTQTLVLVKICTPGDSSRDLFIPKRWRSPTTSKRVTFSPSQKGHQQNSQAHFNFLFITPIGSMYGIFIYIWLIFMVFM